MERSKAIQLSLILLLAAVPVLGASSRLIGTPPRIPEQQLLDVGILVLEPEAPKRSLFLSEFEPTSAEVSKSEATFVAVHLMRTLQQTGRFGLVRVLPRESLVMDLEVTGEIRRSLGRRLEIAIEVTDATGRRWLKRRYKQKANPFLYAQRYQSHREPYQDLYNRVAADLVEVQRRLGTERLEDLRRIAELRYAAQLAPGVFGGYLEKGRRGRIDLERLPSRDDPMLARVREIQVRDEYFLDLLAERYQQFYREMDDPYYDYRANRFEVEIALKNARAQATLANARSLWSPEQSALEVRRTAQRVAFFRRMAAEQARYLDDISATFAVVVEPMVVELDGEILRFTGTIDEQYRQWRALLARIFETETGLSIVDRQAPAREIGSRH